MKTLADMDSRYLELGLEGIRAKIRAIEENISQLYDKIKELRDAEKQYVLALQAHSSQQRDPAKNRKRLQKGLPKKVILEFLKNYGDQTWDSIQKRARVEKNLPIPRSTILGNLKRLKKKGLVLQVDDEHWRLQEQDSPSPEDEEVYVPEPQEDFPTSVEEDDDLPF